MHFSSLPSLPTAAGLLAAGSSLLGTASAAPMTSTAPMETLSRAITSVSNSTAATLAPDSTDQGSSSVVYAFCAIAGAACLIFAAKALDAYQARNGGDTTDLTYNLSPFDCGDDFGVAYSENLPEWPVQRAPTPPPPAYDEASAGLPTYEEAAAASPAASPMPAHEIVLTPTHFLSGTSSRANDA